MKLVTKFLAVALVLGLAGVVSAKDAAPAADQPAKEKKDKASTGTKGTVVKADDKTVTIKTSAKNGGSEITFTVDAKTKITLDGKDAKASDLKEGLKVSITPVAAAAGQAAPAQQTAQTIDAKTAKPKAEKAAK
jgi:hypothetical protein